MAMTRKKKSVAFLASLLLLSSCSSTHIRYPLDYKDPIFPGLSTFVSDYNASNSEDSLSVYLNKKENYYKSLFTGDTVYEKLVKDVLLKLSEKVGNYDSEPGNGDGNGAKRPVYSLVYDVNDDSVFRPTGTLKAASENLTERSKRAILSSASSSSYKKDNLFYENLYVNALRNDFTLPDDFVENDKDKEGVLITPSMTYDDVMKNDYMPYAQKQLQDDMKINYLTAEYIYTRTYSSIGNSLARKVQVISLTDRSDEPGDAKRLLNAYIRDYVHKSDSKYSDPDFQTLARLWKGITPNFVKKPEYQAENRYDSSVVLSADEVQWLKDNKLLSTDESASGTLMGKVLKDIDTLNEGKENPKKADSSVESTYTGSYTYDVDTGIRKAVDDIATKELVTKGIYTSSDGLSSLPSDLKTRLFGNNVSTNKADVPDVPTDGKAAHGKNNDVTVVEPDGFRYLTNEKQSGSDDDNIVYYDSSSKTYYLVRILDAVNSTALEKDNTASLYDTPAKKEQIAREVAYALSTTSDYKKNSTVYWFRRMKMNINDENFLSYLKSNYNDLFLKTSAVDSMSKITLVD